MYGFLQVCEFANSFLKFLRTQPSLPEKKNVILIHILQHSRHFLAKAIEEFIHNAVATTTTLVIVKRNANTTADRKINTCAS